MTGERGLSFYQYVDLQESIFSRSYHILISTCPEPGLEFNVLVAFLNAFVVASFSLHRPADARIKISKCAIAVHVLQSASQMNHGFNGTIAMTPVNSC
jgi:hypothetical protein